MRLSYFADEKHTNFGDELNKIIFPQLFGKLFLNPDGGLFYGIGTLLHVDNPKPAIVFGSGAGYYQAMDLSGVDVRFVRGPRSAEYLGLPASVGITDPAILLADMGLNKQDIEVSFMPRWTTAGNDPTLGQRLEAIGITLLDPRDPAEDVLNRLARSKLVISEALHGAVVADTLRIPWIAAYAEDGHTFKWFDWHASMGLQWYPVDLRVQSLKWAVMHAKRMLSPNYIFQDRLQQVRFEVESLKNDPRYQG